MPKFSADPLGLVDAEDDHEPDAPEVHESPAAPDPEPDDDDPAGSAFVIGAPCARCSFPAAGPLRLLCEACSRALREEARARTRARAAGTDTRRG